MPVYHKTNNEWHPLSTLHYKESGIWGALVSGWDKDAGAWDDFYRPPTVHHIVPDEYGKLENVNIQTLLDAAAPDVNVPAIVVLDEGLTIGSDNPATAALLTGDLAAYVRVIFLNYGEIQGAGGVPNGGNGGDAILATSSMELANYNFIRAGGGAGGQGGTAPGYTKVYDCSGWRYQQGHWPYRPGIGTGYLWHYSGTEKNTQLLFNSSTALCIGPFSLNFTHYDCGGFRYYRGSQTFHHASTGSRHFQIRRCRLKTVANQAGQAGGNGQGYDQVLTLGGDKFANYVYKAGTYDAIPGAGGDGGDWGEDGTDGLQSNDSGAGTAGGVAGSAVNGDANIHWLHNGVIQGALV